MPPVAGWMMNSDATWFEDQDVGRSVVGLSVTNGSLLEVGFQKIQKIWKIKVLEMKAIEFRMLSVLSKFGALIGKDGDISKLKLFFCNFLHLPN